MIFRKQDYTTTNKDPRIESIILAVHDFAKQIVPENKVRKLKEIQENLSVILCENGTKFKALQDNKLVEYDLATTNAAGYHFWTDLDSTQLSAYSGVVFYANAGDHTIVHELLHAFSSEIGKLQQGGFIKVGSKYREFDDNLQVYYQTSNDLNESITDALSSRFFGRIGPGVNASYSAQVILADLLIGPEVKNNKFLQDVYWGDSKKFTQDFNQTVKTTDIDFEQYLQDFKILGNTQEDILKADKLLYGAVEYKIRKTTSIEELDKIYTFLKRVIMFYRDGLDMTGFMEPEDIQRLNDLLNFAEQIKKITEIEIGTKKIPVKANEPVHHNSPLTRN